MALRLALLLVAALAAGCGERVAQAPAPRAAPEALPEETVERMYALDRRMARHCVRVSRSLVDPAEGPTAAQQAAAFAAADELLATAARDPAAPLEAGQDARLFVADVLENLEGANCDPRLLAHLERGLARIPRE